MATTTEAPAPGRSRLDVPTSNVEGSGNRSSTNSTENRLPVVVPSDSEALIAYLRVFMEERDSLQDLKSQTLEILDATDVVAHWVKTSKEGTRDKTAANTRIVAFLGVLRTILTWAYSSGQRVEVFKNWVSETVKTLREYASATKDSSSRKADQLCHDISEDVGRIEYQGKIILQMFDDRAQRPSEGKRSSSDRYSSPIVKDDNVSTRNVKGPKS